MIPWAYRPTLANANPVSDFERRAGHVRRSAILGCLIFLLLFLGQPTLFSAQPLAAAPPDQVGIRFGIAHIDVMENHLERQPDGEPRARAWLDPEEHERRYRLARDSGAAWHRWTIYRELVERPGGFDWKVVDRIVDRDVRSGMDTLAVMQGPSEGMRQPIFLGQAGPTDDPLSGERINPANGWASFVDATVRRLRPEGARSREAGWPDGAGVRAWEIGNEPNLARFWDGSPADFLRYLEVAYLVIRRADPDALIMHGGIGDDGNAEVWYASFLDALALRSKNSPLPARYNHYFDRVAWHWYRQPALLMTGPDRTRALLQSRGFEAKPIWVTETGVPVWAEHPGPCWDPRSPGRASLAEQAGFVWQTFAEAAASGIETIIYFQLSDDCGNGPSSYDAFGLLRNSAGAHCWEAPLAVDRSCWEPDILTAGQPRPAYDAFGVAATELSGANLVQQSPIASDGSRRLIFERQPDTRITVAWTVRSRAVPIELPANAQSAKLFEIAADGQVLSREIARRGSSFPVRLPAATNRNGVAGRPIMAGAPIILIETGVSPTSSGPQGGLETLRQDSAPPVLAMVEALPSRSPRRLDLSIIAGDADSGVAAFVVYVARGARVPTSPSDWTPLGGPGIWNGDPQAGRVRLRYDGRDGETVYFAAQAGDHAGNWTAMPTYPQATTRIAAERLQRPRVKPVGRVFD